ncbi:gamma-parvin [Sorex araneus]|uniref:gamma-parvin n=1 Tax=Sorex araneus TaxID=42254 RepID=UPI00033153AA|nr:gamma-parvin [Sorex araneus]
MEPKSSSPLLPLELGQAGEAPLPGEKKKFLPPMSRADPKFEELQKVLIEWINAQLLPEHIVVRSLEEDMFDGLVLHHLLQRLAGLQLEVEEMALTASSRRRKLTVVLDAINRSLQVEQPPRWSVDDIFNKDLLATLHLLLALAARFQPDLALPSNVRVEVILMESTKSGLKSEKLVEQLTGSSPEKDQPSRDVIDELFKLPPERVNAVREAIVNFVNQKLGRLGLSVQSLESQFADGVLLLLLIGQLEGFFLHLKEFHLTPSSPAEMLHNVRLALELLKEKDPLGVPVSPEDIVNGDPRSTLWVLYGLFCRHHPREPPAELPS